MLKREVEQISPRKQINLRQTGRELRCRQSRLIMGDSKDHAAK